MALLKSIHAHGMDPMEPAHRLKVAKGSERIVCIPFQNAAAIHTREFAVAIDFSVYGGRGSAPVRRR